ncbi:uncharacterized protein LOC108141700 [Drosophila elegans]|uniref:uncharacterized protein LOC108141700 n=1 Tax=Drosophila elegans TaxID=30023 RepID=UPI0007E6A679|nr:uncharacterized protein LOC108141700 [Drosophila elegans]
MRQNAVNKERPIYRGVQLLTDDQLSTLCESYRILLGPITPRNRRLAERHLHIAMIGERAKYRAQQQFAEECKLPITASFQPVPPPQQHYGSVKATPDFRQPIPPPNFWPSFGSFKLRSPPPPTRYFKYRGKRPDPVLEPRQYVTWRQRNSLANQSRAEPGPNILGFEMPFSMEDFKSRISNTIKRFQGGGEEEAEIRLQNRCADPDREKDQKYENRFQKKCHDKHPDNYHYAYQESYRNAYQKDFQRDDEEQFDEDDGEEASDRFFQKDPDHTYAERDTLSDVSDDEGHQQDKENQDSRKSPFPFEIRKLQGRFNGADGESQSELGGFMSFHSLASVYHEFTNQVPMARTQPRPRRWWWLGREAAGDERIPEAERTTEQDLVQERELKTINYLSEAPSRVDDGMLELMGRVELRDDSDEEEGTVEQGQSGPSSRSYSGFCRHIFHLLCCDRHGKLDAEKLRCNFFCCCMAFAIYMGFKLMR